MKTIPEIEAQFIDDFNQLENWEEKYDYLIELGDSLPEMPAELKTADNLVKGCQSSVWFATRCEDGRLFIEADSDSLIIKGIVAILVQLLSGQPSSDIAHADLTMFETLGLWRHLSSQRSNGVTAMMAHLKQSAATCQIN
ncbi:MAG: SufE family protein [Chloroflexi bacterium]|nr:SufE family protein [Chloroflexota bacterium]